MALAFAFGLALAFALALGFALAFALGAVVVFLLAVVVFFAGVFLVDVFALALVPAFAFAAMTHPYSWADVRPCFRRARKLPEPMAENHIVFSLFQRRIGSAEKDEDSSGKRTGR
ncbi:MAG: hypothetical protein RJQ07_12110 [Pseudomonadales bacterium]